MTTTELQVLRENRLQGENLNTTKIRLEKEAKLMPVLQAQPDQKLIPILPNPSENQKKQEQARLPYENPEAPMSDEDGFFTTDLMIPRLKIVQPSSRIEGVKDGCFYNSLTGEIREKLENIVFLTRRNGRVLFPENDYTGLRTCWSDDGITPATGSVFMLTGENPKSHSCMIRNNGGKKVVCPFAEWHKTEKGNAVPECKETISFLGLDMQSFTPFFMIFHGTGIPPVKNFISSVFLKKKQATIQSKELHLRDFRLVISLKLQINEKGKFHLPVFEKTEEITAENERMVLSRCFDALSKKKIEPELNPDEE